MYKKQAIEKLNDIRCHVKETSAEEQALVMAIEALKQPEIVHCGECGLYYLVPSGRRRCSLHCTYTKPDDFCSLAERRTE